MNENKLDFIKNGLANYIGSLQDVVDLQGWEKNQYIASVLIDAITQNVARVHEDSAYCEPFVLVPVFTAMQGILMQQIQRIQQDPSTEDEPEARIERYNAMIGELTHLAEYGMLSRKEFDFGKKETDDSNGDEN